MKPKLKYVLIKLEKAIVFQVLEMDERFRCKGSITQEFTTNEFDVLSDERTEIEHDAIYLRGSNKAQDFFVSTRYFSENADRDKAFDVIQLTLREWSEKWEGFRESEPVKAKDESGFIFEV